MASRFLFGSAGRRRGHRLRAGAVLALAVALVPASVQAVGSAQASVRSAPGSPEAAPSATAGRAALLFPGDRQRVGASSWTLRGQVAGPGKGGVSARFNVQDVTAGDKWVARNVGGTAVDAQGQSSLRVTGLINGHTYRWSMAERAGDLTSAAAAWSTFTVDTTVVPAPAITSAGYREDGWSLATRAGSTFKWSDTSPRDVGGWEYKEDGASWSRPAAATGLSWNPVSTGPHTLQVRAVNSAGLPGAAATYTFATYKAGEDPQRPGPGLDRAAARSSAASVTTCPEGSLDSPVEGESSDGTVLLAASTSSSGCEWVNYLYSFDGGLDWNLISPTTAQGGYSDGAYIEFPVIRWDVAQALVTAGDGLGGTPVYVQACWYPTDEGAKTSNGTCSPQTEFNYSPAAFGGANADTTIGPGSLALGSGDFDVSSTDATGFSPYGDIEVSRDFTTLSPAQNSWNPNPNYTGNSGNGPSGFGPGWTADFEGSQQDSPAADTVEGAVVSGSAPESSVWLTSPQDTVDYYTAMSATYPITYQGYGAAGEDGSTLVLSGASGPLTLTEKDGTKIVWTLSDQSSGDATEFTGEISQVIQPGGEATQYLENSAGEITTIVAPAAPGITCGSAATTTPGCRSLTIDYAGTTTATGTSPGQWGSYAGNISAIQYNAAAPSNPASMESVTVAAYEYDSDGYLREFYNPQITSCSAPPCLPTTYGYTTQTYQIDGQATQLTQLTSITPPGLNAWDLGYDADARLAAVSRADPNGGTDTTTIIYNVPITGGAGLPTTSPVADENSYEPGQYESYTQSFIYTGGTGTPATATAVFPPTHTVSDSYDSSGDPAGVTSADWPYASVYYVDDNGYLVDTASYGDGAWQVGYTNYDQDLSGRVVNTVSAEAVDECSDPTAYPDMDPYVASLILDLGSNCGEVATDLGTTNTYTGPELTETAGPFHLAEDGAYAPNDAILNWPAAPPELSLIDGQLQTSYTYNQGAPATGGPYYLQTTVTTEFYAYSLGGPTDWQTTQYGYAAIDSGDTTGWALREPTTSTIDYPYNTDINTPSPDITTTTRYNPQGQVIESRMPSDPAGGTAGTTLTSYYTATGSGPCVNVAEAGQVCQTAPAAQPSTGPALPTTTTSYNLYGEPVTAMESNGTTTRTTTAGYDAAGRPVSDAITVTPAANGGTPVPATSFGYDPNTGLPATITSAGGVTITTGYDSDGRAVTYQDGSQPQATTTYNADGQVATVNDGQGTMTYTYGSATDHRDLPTELTDSRAGTFTASYDADGLLDSETYPNGLTETRTYDDTGALVGLTYAQSGTTWLSWSDNYSDLGQLAEETLSTADNATLDQTFYIYDFDQRLTNSAEYNDQFPAECLEISSYSYDADSNRISQTTPQPNGGNCPTTDVTIAHTYDQADRATDADSDFATDEYTYDDLGRTLTVPSSDVVDTAQNDSEVTLTYYANDMVHSIEQPYTEQTYGLDPASRILTTSAPDGNGGTVVTTNDYTSSSDSPAWTSSSDDGSTPVITRNITGLDGLTDAEMIGSTLYLDINDPQGSIAAQVPAAATGLYTTAGGQPAYDGYTAFGLNDISCYNGQCNSPQLPYGYLGGHARTSTGIGGIILMGQRLYNPTTGRFLQPDPVPGGSANAYDYTNQDPLDNTDLTGTSDSPGDCEQYTKLPDNGPIPDAILACAALNNCLHIDPMVCSQLGQGPLALQEDELADLIDTTNESMYNWMLEEDGIPLDMAMAAGLAYALFPDLRTPAPSTTEGCRIATGGFFLALATIDATGPGFWNVAGGLYALYEMYESCPVA